MLEELKLAVGGLSHEFWLGYNDKEVEGDWRWNDGTPNDFSFWNPGEPNSLT